jgi:hypothetical protein
VPQKLPDGILASGHFSIPKRDCGNLSVDGKLASFRLPQHSVSHAAFAPFIGAAIKR